MTKEEITTLLAAFHFNKEVLSRDERKLLGIAEQLQAELKEDRKALKICRDILDSGSDIVWADDATPFTGEQVADLLKENEQLRADVKELARTLNLALVREMTIVEQDAAIELLHKHTPYIDNGPECDLCAVGDLHKVSHPEKEGDTLDLTHAEFVQQISLYGEYSCSMPTGTTVGKIWFCNKNAFRSDTQDEDWYRAEYQKHDDPNMVRVVWRKVRIVP